jgi:hypothetical protein
MIVVTALLSIAILAAFFYQVHLVSHIKNIMQTQMYWYLGDKELTDQTLSDLRVKGVITKQMEHVLKQGRK